MDFEISNAKATQLAHGAMQIYFLRDNPQRTAHEFAKSFNLGFNGFMIEIKENNSRLPTSSSVIAPYLINPIEPTPESA